MTSAVTSSCGTTASDDVWSASKIMDKYCNPAKAVAFPTPTTNVVNAFITELAEISYLPQCAQSAVSYAVMGDVCYPERKRVARPIWSKLEADGP